MKYGGKVVQTKLLPRLSHKVCHLLSSPVLLRHPKAILPHQNAKNHTKSKVSSGKNNSLHFHSNKSNCVAIDGNFFSPQLLQLLRQYYLASSGSVYGLKSFFSIQNIQIDLFWLDLPKHTIDKKFQLLTIGKISVFWTFFKLHFSGLKSVLSIPKY